jgi:hypothetical protein
MSISSVKDSMRPKRVTKEVMPLPKKKDNKEDKKYDRAGLPALEEAL